MSTTDVIQLPESDLEYLTSKEYTFEVRESGNKQFLIVKDFDLPEHYVPQKTDLLIIIPTGYPNSNPDMFWTYPDVKLKNGAWPLRSEHHENYLDLSWQRWSRHFTRNTWRPGVDGIRTYLGAIRRELQKGK